MGTLNTQSNHANYHKFGQVLNSPPLETKCKTLIMRISKGSNEAKVKSEKGKQF